MENKRKHQIVSFQIKNYQGTTNEDKEIASLLDDVFVKEGYTDKSRAEKIFPPTELQKRGEIILATSVTGQLLGMIIFVRPTSPARQVAEPDEAEIHLLAVCPKVRSQGIGSQLIMSCEQRATSLGYSKIVLSTQQAMKEAHRVYEKLGYRRNPARDWSRDADRIYFVYEKLLGLG